MVKNVEEKVVSIPKDATQKEKKNTLKTKVSEKIKNLKNPNYPNKEDDILVRKNSKVDGIRKKDGRSKKGIL